jgi:aspartyl-tRNA(Asn)/glutamyl-tRNA(Gln) amidotransferase subunit A
VTAVANVAAAEARAAEVAALNALVHTDWAWARTDAAAIDADPARAAGALGGVPVAIKDNIATLAPFPTTCASRILAGYVSPFEATVVTRLRAAGAVVVGKANMDEFAMGSSTEHSCYGPTRHPVDPTRVPGGSSGGSAVAVAAGIVPLALGSETGGSVRQPAAYCGIVGVKPTYGRVSRFGLVAFGSSLDQVGVLARDVAGAARGLAVIAGRDDRDATSADVAVPDLAAATGDGTLAGLTVGVPREYFPDTLDPAMRARCDAALEALRAAGVAVREVSLPHTRYAIPVYYIIAPAEASSNLARFDGVRYGYRAAADSLRAMYDTTRTEGFGAEVTRRILLGTYVLSHGYYDAYYRKAQDVRALITRDFRRVFADGVDVLFTPSTPTPAFPIGGITDPYAMYLNDIYTATANLAGVPAVSVPIGTVGGLPVGGQLIAPHFGEAVLFRVAHALERARPGAAA